MNNVALTAPLALALLAAACAAPPPAPTAPDRGQIEPNAQLHGIHSARLRDIMGRMNALVADGSYAPLLLDSLRTEYMQSLIDAAGDVVYTAETLDDHELGAQLDEDQKVVFAALADQLYADAVNVEHHARMTDFNELEVAYRRLEKTCIACHALFRELPFPLME